MRIKILHEMKGRIRFAASRRRLAAKEADALLYYIYSLEGVKEAKVYERTGNAVVCYQGNRQRLLDKLQEFSFSDEKQLALVPQNTGRELTQFYKEKLITKVALHYLCRFFLPRPLAAARTLFHSLHFILDGLRCLKKGRLQVPVLDGTAISVSLLRKDFKTAGTIMFLLTIGEILEEWTHKKSVADLARSMSLNVEKVWLKTEGQEVLTDIQKIRAQDVITVQMGSLIPLDGVVTSGEAMVNQASLTGEGIPVKKEAGAYVYSGTVVEEGQLEIQVKQIAGQTRYEKIVSMIEESDKLKSMVEGKAGHLADKLVPYSLLGTGLVYGITGNATKALSILMVDFSCALKLSVPIAVLAAMRECQEHQITVKGGKFMEAVAEADTIVFDKTGTFTKAQPTLAEVIPFGGEDPVEMLRLAACLEEHFPHSIANAVVAGAAKEGLTHEEFHSKVEYVVAHGISSMVNEKKVMIGSYHFIFEDEKCIIPQGEESRFYNLPQEYSHLYLAISGVLAAVLCIEDPLREEAKEIVDGLRRLGIKDVVMMTGDSKHTAEAIARRTGVDQFFAEVLPEEKAAFVEKEKALGKKVIMVGDGINDSPALSAADAGIAIGSGAQLAREISDITVSGDDLHQLIILKQISNQLMKRIQRNYRFVIAFNAGLIALGLAGVITPAASALFHNVSTLGITLESMTNLLKDVVE